MSDTDRLESQVNEIEVDRALGVARYGAATEHMVSLVRLNGAHAKLTEARANLRTAFTLAILAGIVLASVATAHFV